MYDIEKQVLNLGKECYVNYNRNSGKETDIQKKKNGIFRSLTMYHILHYIQIKSIPNVEQFILAGHRLNFTEKREEENYVDRHLETYI